MKEYDDTLKQKLQDIANLKVRYGDIYSFDEMSKEMSNIRGYDCGQVALAKSILNNFFGENYE